MKKQKILFIMPYFGCGGVESTLLSLLNVIDKKKYEITMLLLQKKGGFLEQIPKEVEVLEIEIPEKEKGIFFGKRNVLKSYIKRGMLWKIPGFLSYNFQNGLSENRTNNAIYFERISEAIPVREEEYDIAIDYFGYAAFTTFYLAEKVNAKVKVSWLHSILSRFEPQAFQKWYEKMDVIFACSKKVQADFESMFPKIKCVRLFYNIINPENIRQKAIAEGGFTDSFNGLRILTVGRICHEKGIDLAAEAFKKLLANGYRIRWYLVGGSSEADCNKITAMFETEEEKENFVFLGTKKNPYVFMKQCDIYVQPSRFEGYCTATNEARIIGRPIVMTDVSGAREQIIDGKTGFIVDSDGDAIYEGIKKLVEQPELRKRFVQNLQYIDCDSRKEINKLINLVE